ncbi:MAG: hypothetical protein IPO60_02010 [Flavobacteriales bacterium]|nr:hypothetical protein [Flavobacteriales bacterium]
MVKTKITVGGVKFVMVAASEAVQPFTVTSTDQVPVPTVMVGVMAPLLQR